MSDFPPSARKTLFAPEVGRMVELKLVEQAAARNLRDFVEATRRVAPGLGGTAVACGDGVAAFLGVDSPLTTVKGVGPDLRDEEIDVAERFFHGCGAAKATFEVAPWISKESEERLSRRGYRVVDHEDVVVRASELPSVDPDRAVSLVAEQDWPALQLQVNDEPASSEWRALAGACAILPDAVSLGIRDVDGVWIACAQLVSAGQVGILGNDATLTSARRQGAQAALILARVKVAAGRPFVCLTAEVAPGSTSERNYVRCGFDIAYTRAHYARDLGVNA